MTSDINFVTVSPSPHLASCSDVLAARLFRRLNEVSCRWGSSINRVAGHAFSCVSATRWTSLPLAFALGVRGHRNRTAACGIIITVWTASRRVGDVEWRKRDCHLGGLHWRARETSYRVAFAADAARARTHTGRHRPRGSYSRLAGRAKLVLRCRNDEGN